MRVLYLDSLYGLINKCLYFGIRILIIFLFSKNSTTTDFATFVYLLNIVEIGRLLLDFGIDSTYIRMLARMNGNEVKKSAEVIVSQKFLTSILASSMIVVICYILGTTKIFPLLLGTAFILPFISVNSFINVIFQAKNNNRIILPYYVAAFLISALSIFLFKTSIPFYNLYAIIELVFFLVLVLAMFKKFRFKPRKISLIDIRKSYKASFYNGTSQTVVTLYSKTDLLFIQKLSSAVNVAYYGFFMRVMDPLLMIASALATSAYSFFSKNIDSIDRLKVQRNLRQYLLITFVYALTILTTITVLLPLFLEITASKYKITSSLAFLYGLSTAVRIISAALGGILLSMGKFSYTFKLSMLNICLLFPLYFALIPLFNLKGVLSSIIISETISVLIKARTLKPILF